MSDEEAVSRKPIEEEWLDQLMPEEFDWKTVVVEHPLLSITAAAVGGFLLGRWQGREIFDAASDVALTKVNTSVDRFISSASGREL